MVSLPGTGSESAFILSPWIMSRCLGSPPHPLTELFCLSRMRVSLGPKLPNALVFGLISFSSFLSGDSPGASWPPEDPESPLKACNFLSRL